MEPGTISLNDSIPAQHVFMVLAEYAFILRVIQMEKRKGDAARRQLRKSVKAVVAANQVMTARGSPAELFHQMELSLFLCSIAHLSSPPLAAHPGEPYVFLAPRPQGRRAERRLHAIRTGMGKPLNSSEFSKSYLIFQETFWKNNG